MRIGYIRVSTDEQNIERQEAALKAAGVEKIFMDKLSGKNMARPGLKEMLAYIRDGDIVIVESYSRLARSLKDLINIIDEIKNKKADFYSIKENSDTSSAAGKLIMNIFGALYEFERECLLERQKEGTTMMMGLLEDMDNETAYLKSLSDNLSISYENNILTIGDNKFILVK